MQFALIDRHRITARHQPRRSHAGNACSHDRKTARAVRRPGALVMQYKSPNAGYDWYASPAAADHAENLIRPARISVFRAKMAYAHFAEPSFSRPAWLRQAGFGANRRAAVRVRMKEEPSTLSAQMSALVVLVGERGDRAAFAALFGHFAPRVKSYLLRLGASSPLAEDLAQEAMLSIWRKAALFDPAKASASTWIFTIARNLRIDAIRRERHPEFDPNDPALVPDEEPRADARMMRDLDDANVHAALAKLSPDQAKVVQMSFFADKPQSQIAKELGVPLGTVKSRMRLAMAHIRAAIGKKT
ncbi:MAG: sigma-70 family RNA polymerase sigma factor [Rhizomicrobium sp.]